MRTRRTRRARGYLLGLACVCAAAVLLASVPLALLALALTFAYAHLRWTFAADVRRLHLTAERTLAQTQLYADQIVHVTVSVRGENPGRLRLRARDQLPAVWSVVEGSPEGADPTWGAPPTWRYGARPAGRGSSRFGAVEVVAGDPHGLFEAEEPIPLPLHVSVNASIGAVKRGRAYARKKPFDPRRKDAMGLIFRDYEFEGIRQYQGGDRMRDIDWKATTRLHEMMTKTFEREMEGIVYCLVDASRPMRERTPGTPLTKLDHAAELVLQVGEMAGQRNFQVGLIVFDETGILVEVPASRAKGQERVLAERILEIPDPIEVRRRLDAHAPGSVHDPAESNFLARLGELRGGAVGESLAVRARRRGAGAAASSLLARHPAGSIFAFAFSDFAVDPDGLSRALVVLRERGHKIAVGAFPDNAYLRPPPSPTVRDVENAYRSMQARRKAMHLLRSRGALVQELDPQKSFTSLVEEKA